MYRFAYPAAKYDEEHLDKNIILNLITKHHAIMSQKQKCMDYYMGMHDILSRKREDGLPNAKVVCNHAKDITDTATGYFMGNPITYSNTDDADIEPLLSAFDDADVDEVDADNAQDMSICPYMDWHTNMFMLNRMKQNRPLKTFLLYQLS